MSVSVRLTYSPKLHFSPPKNYDLLSLIFSFCARTFLTCLNDICVVKVGAGGWTRFKVGVRFKVRVRTGFFSFVLRCVFGHVFVSVTVISIVCFPPFLGLRVVDYLPSVSTVWVWCLTISRCISLLRGWVRFCALSELLCAPHELLCYDSLCLRRVLSGSSHVKIKSLHRPYPSRYPSFSSTHQRSTTVPNNSLCLSGPHRRVRT